MNKIKTEVAAIVGLLLGAAELALTAFPDSTLNNILKVSIIPVGAIVGIRPNVVPLAKVVGDITKLVPLAVRLERVASDLLSHKASVVATVKHVVELAPQVTEQVQATVKDAVQAEKEIAAKVAPKKPAARPAAKTTAAKAAEAKKAAAIVPAKASK